jgi:hypothetical protein
MLRRVLAQSVARRGLSDRNDLVIRRVVAARMQRLHVVPKGCIAGN